MTDSGAPPERRAVPRPASPGRADVGRTGAARHFAQSYAEARDKFFAAARSCGLGVESHVHPLAGRDGEMLATDVARDGPMNASAVLVLSSACHGVEGFCGSGVQVALLSDPAWQEAARDAGVAVVYVHGLNPHGFSWWRRTTHENVDLNRNFRDFAAPAPANDRYDEIASAVVPATWPADAASVAALERFVHEHGERELQQAISGGQYRHPDGLFYGGSEPAWSHTTLRQVLRQHGSRCQRLAWIDFHTGLGPSGHGERIFACRNDARAYARAKAWWGDVTSIYDGSSTSAVLTGLMTLAAYDECAQAEFTAIALEYGTRPQPEVMLALRADQWLQNHPDADDATRSAIKRQVRDAFYIDTDEWKEQIVAQGVDAARGALRGLGNG
ncbi:MAG TPA: M14 family metallopeptidase [Caldimonas sp.]|nr:M14 family metallopeptidase [Caldimonas sp.]